MRIDGVDWKRQRERETDSLYLLHPFPLLGSCCEPGGPSDGGCRVPMMWNGTEWGARLDCGPFQPQISGGGGGDLGMLSGSRCQSPHLWSGASFSGTQGSSRSTTNLSLNHQCPAQCQACKRCSLLARRWANRLDAVHQVQKTFAGISQIGNILSFVSHTISVATTQFCSCSVKQS